MKSTVIFCFFSLLFLYSYSGTGTSRIADVALEAPGPTEANCLKDMTISNNKLLQQECENFCTNYNGLKLNSCLTEACNKNCKNKTTAKMYECADDTISATQTINTIKNKCKQSCSQNEYGDYNFSDDNTVQQTCANENKNKLADNLKKTCKDELPDQLICPGGNSSNNNCEQYCTNEANKQIINNIQSCNSITTKGEFDNCQKQLQAQIKIPKKATDLPKDKDFAWQECASGMECESRLQVSFDTALQACQNIKSNALICCGENLSKCIASDFGKEANLFKGTSSITALCQKIKKEISNTKNIIQKISSQCQTDSSSCVQLCSAQIKDTAHSAFWDMCAFDLNEDQKYTHGTHTCSESLINKYTNYYKAKLAPILTECESANSKSQQQAQVTTEELLKSALSASNCTQQVSGGENSLFNSNLGESNQAEHATNTADSHLPETDTAAPTNANVNKRKSSSGATVGSGGGSRFSKASGRVSFRSPSGDSKLSSSSDSSNKITSDKSSASSGAPPGKGVTQNDTLSAAPSRAQADAGSDDKGQKKPSKLSPDKQKKGKTKDKEENMNNHSLASSLKTGNRRPQSTKLSWDRIKHHKNINARMNAFGSPHSNIFKNISNRIFSMCKTEKINCADY